MLQKILLGLFIISFFTASCQNLGEETIYLIPKGYEGNILVIFDQPNGNDAVYENGKRVYKIDNSGVLRTKFSVNRKPHIARFYIVDYNGKRVEIKLVTKGINESVGSTQVICTGLVPVNDYDQKRKVERASELFIIAKGVNVDSIANEQDDFMSNSLK
jgi:hypothetical protein